MGMKGLATGVCHKNYGQRDGHEEFADLFVLEDKEEKPLWQDCRLVIEPLKQESLINNSIWELKD